MTLYQARLRNMTDDQLRQECRGKLALKIAYGGLVQVCDDIWFEMSERKFGPEYLAIGNELRTARWKEQRESLERFKREHPATK